jgi:hypothetical protein
VLANPNSFGLVGSDVINEWFYKDPNIDVRPIAPMNNASGDALRFAVIARDELSASPEALFIGAIGRTSMFGSL